MHSSVCSKKNVMRSVSQPLGERFSHVPLQSLRCGLAALPRRSRKAFVVNSAASAEYDADKESSLKYRRVVYDFEKWANHRSTKRYLRHLNGMLSSRIVRGLAAPLAVEAAIATSVCTYEWAIQQGLLPDFLPSIAANVSAPYGLSSFALSLLLVFRTNASYGRFDEARKFWGGVVNRSRDLTRQFTGWMDPETERERIEMCGRWAIAFPWAMMCHLRTGEKIEELKPYLTEEELSYLVSTAHRPNTVLQVLSELIWTSNVSVDKKFRMDENLTFFADMLGASERILRTPIPLSYTRHTSRFMLIWLLFLPFAIYGQAGWSTIPASVLIAFVLLAIEEIGVQIEEPFSVLPLKAISTTITTNIKHHLQRELPLALAEKAAVADMLDTQVVEAVAVAEPMLMEELNSEPEVEAEPALAVLTMSATVSEPEVAESSVTPGVNGQSSTSPAAAYTNGGPPANGGAPQPPARELIEPKPLPDRPVSRFDRKLREYLDRKRQSS